MNMVTYTPAWPEGLRSEAATLVDRFVADRAVERIWSADHLLWQSDPTEVTDRLGWLHVIEDIDVSGLESFAQQCVRDGFTDALVLGMGGSSLFPEVLAQTYPVGPGSLRLQTLDTTDPAAILRAAESATLDTTLFIVASKSGTTIETRSQLELLWSKVGNGDQFIAITDPDSQLVALAAQRGFRATFENRSDIGGRFSALSLFGLVPAALMGVEVGPMLASAGEAARACRSNGADNPAVQLAAAIVAANRAGRDKLTLVTDPRLAAFGLWFEQLIAESTGKRGTGVLPVVGERSLRTGDDRLFVHWAGVDAQPDGPTIIIDQWSADDLGALVFVWEMTTALIGAGLGVNPFDQPDVASAKAATNEVLESGLSVVETVSLSSLTGSLSPGDYLAVTAYVDPGSEDVAVLEAAREALADRLGVVTTFGLGPRFLHSTGQLHKGGRDNGVIVQVVSDDEVDVDIPGAPYSFSTLKQAQAQGDLAVLKQKGIRSGRVELSELAALVS
ncbi:MAG: glucose-6-phosphate isomerase [Acidobacteria bacterium]|nr:glucose-6-phosphate isomerase [Acidobacteriota bacterium]